MCWLREYFRSKNWATLFCEFPVSLIHCRRPGLTVSFWSHRAGSTSGGIPQSSTPSISGGRVILRSISSSLIPSSTSAESSTAFSSTATGSAAHSDLCNSACDMCVRFSSRGEPERRRFRWDEDELIRDG